MFVQKLKSDYLLIAIILLLTLLGLVTLYSASFLFALNQPRRFSSGYAPLIGNLAACGIMLFLFPILSLFKLNWLKNGKMVIFLLGLTFILNLLPFIPFFQKTWHRHGTDAMRWIVLKHGGQDFVSFQPSELIKIILPLYLAYILDKNREKMDLFFYGPVPPAIITFIFFLLVLAQSNFSEAVLITLTSFIICFAAGIRLRWFAAAIAVLTPIFWLLISSNKEGRWYQRISSFLSKEPDPAGAGYQIMQSIDAIKSGGFWGKGIGQGLLKTRMPEVHGDFVFASYAEESGFIGVAFYLALIGLFAWIGYLTAWRSRDRFSQIFAFGLVTSIVVQTLLNIAVVVNLIPTTGIPLPFVSSGGSSLLITLIASALLVNMARQNIHSQVGGEHAG